MIRGRTLNPSGELRLSRPGAHLSHQYFRGELVAAVDLDLLQGTLDLLILKTLTWGPRHGYAVASWIREATEQRLQIEEGALYTALHRMEKRGWIESEWGLSENNRRAKYYQLTSQGRKQLRAKTAVWTDYAAAVFKVLQTA
jgi:transcriptional regulator